MATTFYNADKRNFYEKYMVATGRGNTGSDTLTTYTTFEIPQEDFEKDYEKAVAASEYDCQTSDEKRKWLHDDYHSIPTNSPYDCTGKVCGVSRTVLIVHYDYDKWVVTVKDTVSIDV